MMHLSKTAFPRAAVPKQMTDESGFSMLEVLIAGAITVLIAFGIATLMNSTTKQETNIRVKQEAFSYQQQMRYERKVAEPVGAD